VVIIIRWNSRFNLRNALPRLVAQTQKATFREEDLNEAAGAADASRAKLKKSCSTMTF